ncbi:hypothetical protein [Paracoccus sp. (in: a-proteobacteria)]|uniref:hypothetical protein n=1 Tax=Paracoccus sp. TaxID=267 RepID=UPI0026DF874F|nr:hypothetical protein [Paracoccus sp. (in: a-proteobacteria)]MDO5648872.1 hypothetical protein [Paracoccus sp. (in: a-proteobacteria)]
MSWLPVLTAAIASATALYIAVFVYPVQKAKDRELKIDEERRAAFAKFIEASEGYFSRLRAAVPVSVTDMPDTADDQHRTEAALALLTLYADAALSDQAQGYLAALLNYRRALQREKPLRPEAEDGQRVKRTDDYRKAQDARDRAYKAVLSSREVCFNQMRASLAPEVSKYLGNTLTAPALPDGE